MTVAKIFLNAPPEFSWSMFCYLPPSFSQGSCCGEDFTVQKAVLNDNRGRGKSALLSMGHLTPTTAFNHKQWEIAIHIFVNGWQWPHRSTNLVVWRTVSIFWKTLDLIGLVLLTRKLLQSLFHFTVPLWYLQIITKQPYLIISTLHNCHCFDT